MGRLFGTDGVRGIANSELTAEIAFKLGQAGALVLTKATNHKAKILIGKDTRISGDMLEAALAAGICSVGAEAVLLGVMPTPAVAYITRTRKADAGIVISASHNSMEFNGIKFFDGNGFKLPDKLEDEIEDIIKNGGSSIPIVVGADVGSITYDHNSLKEYESFAESTIPGDLNGMKIAIDCANGASYEVSQNVLERLGAQVSVIHNKPTGININKNCGSTHLGDLQAFVKETGSDIGFAFDGDADRVLTVDENGEVVDGDKMMCIVAKDMKESGKLPNDTIVVTVMSNLGLHIAAKENGMNLEITKVGDRYVLEKMIECGYKIGGEQSGHVILTEHNNTGDGLVSALQLAHVVRKSGKKLSELAQIMTVLPQVLINAKVVGNKDAYKEDAEIMALINDIEAEFAGEGRVLIRPSGTEPLVRVMIEGKCIDKITERARALANLIESKLG